MFHNTQASHHDGSPEPYTKLYNRRQQETATKQSNLFILSIEFARFVNMISNQVVCLYSNINLHSRCALPHHLTFCEYISFHRHKSNDFCLIQNCPTNREGYIIIAFLFNAKVARNVPGYNMHFIGYLPMITDAALTDQLTKDIKYKANCALTLPSRGCVRKITRQMDYCEYQYR